MGAHQMLLGAGGGFAFTQTISGNTTNYNLRSSAIAAGWNGSSPLIATVTVKSGVCVGSTSTGAYSFDTGTPFPAGSVINLINNGLIVGKGGAGGNGSTSGAGGGPALRAQYAMRITNAGTIGGGGGGGGGGSYTYGSDGAYHAGEGGGGGAGYSVGGGGGGSAYNGAAGTLTTGGGGGGSYHWPNYNGRDGGTTGGGGTGGGLGVAGGSGGAGWRGDQGGGGHAINGQGGGGAAGACTSGNANITWVSTGTRLGTLS